MIRLLRRLFGPHDDAPLRHVPIQTIGKDAIEAQKIRKEKLTAAKAKYRRPFAHESGVKRETEPSILLADINRRVEEEGRRVAQKPIELRKAKP